MTLDQYMRTNSVHEAELAEKLACSVGAVRKWLSGERLPRPEQMQKIVNITDGQVTANDFYGIAPSSDEAAPDDQPEAAA